VLPGDRQCRVIAESVQIDMSPDNGSSVLSLELVRRSRSTGGADPFGFGTPEVILSIRLA
jgi:hypothetical protein